MMELVAPPHTFFPRLQPASQFKSKPLRRLPSSSALPETAAAASVLLASAAVGVAATLLVKRTSSSSSIDQQPTTMTTREYCQDCGGTGICSECKGEGFVFKKLPEETAEKARKAAKNMATRYTAGLPSKWTYCTKCSSTRSCTTCAGSGKLT